MRFDFRCSNCGEVAEFAAKTDERWVPCGNCRMPAERQFNLNVAFVVPARFAVSRGFGLPPKGSPKWENLVEAGSVKPDREESFRDYIEAQ